MTTKISNAEEGHTPATIENCATIYRNDSNIYNVNDSSDGLYELRQNKTIQDFANVGPDTYELIKATNPTLLMFVDLAKRIMGVEA